MKALLPALLLAGAAFAAEDCMLDAKDIKPQLASKLPKGFKLVSTKKEKRSLTQVLKLPDTTEVAVNISGCEHLKFSFAIKGPGLTPKTVGAELVAIARRVLPQVPVAKDAHADPKMMLEAIDEARIDSLPAELPCGDAHCRMALETETPKAVKGKKPKKDAPAPEGVGVLTFSYDFAI